MQEESSSSGTLGGASCGSAMVRAQTTQHDEVNELFAVSLLHDTHLSTFVMLCSIFASVNYLLFKSLKMILNVDMRSTTCCKKEAKTSL